LSEDIAKQTDPGEEELEEVIEALFPKEDSSKESCILELAYYRSFISALQKSSSTYHDELLRTARMLLDKDLDLAGAFFEKLPEAMQNTGPDSIRKWVGIGIKIFDQGKDLAIDYFLHSAELLKDLQVSELEEWALNLFFPEIKELNGIH